MSEESVKPCRHGRYRYCETCEPCELEEELANTRQVARRLLKAAVGYRADLALQILDECPWLGREPADEQA